MYEFDQKKKIKINTFFFQKDLKHKEDLIVTHSKKFEELKEFTYNLNEKNFNKLKELAISPNGFLTLELRRKIYDKILLLGEANVENEKYDFLFLDQQRSRLTSNKIYFNKLQIGQEEIGKYYLNQVKKSKFEDIIEKDGDRSVIYGILKNTEEEEVSLNSGNYNYYQGYHDIGLYFYILYIENTFKSIAVFQRVTECYFKDYLNEKQDSYFPYHFILEIVDFLIKGLDSQVYEEIKEKIDEVSPFWTTSWVLSWFTHNIKNPFLVYRIFDYLLVAHPLAIYYMSAIITINEYKKALAENTDQAKFFQHIQNLDFSAVDFDKIILMTEASLNRFSTRNVINHFNKKLPMNSFLRSRDLPIFVFYSKAYKTENEKHLFLIYFLTFIAVLLTVERFLNLNWCEIIIRNVKNNITLLSISD